LDTLRALIARQEDNVKITIEISFDGETPVITAKAQSQAALEASDAGAAPDAAAPDVAATPSLAAASATGALTDAGAPKPPPFDLPSGVLAATDYPAMNKQETEIEAEDAGAAPQVK
jgi:hypothetical protein